MDQMLQLLNQLVAASHVHHPAAVVAPPTQHALAATPTRDTASISASSGPRRSHEEEV